MTTCYKKLLTTCCASLAVAMIARITYGHDHAAMHSAAAGTSPGPAIATSADEHAHHHAAMAAPSISISKRTYPVPAATLLDESGHKVELARVLGGDRPVVLNFIYTSCTTICPVMTATMLQLQRSLAGSKQAPMFVSITVDPDFDSAKVLKAYALRFGADWTFLTGSRDEVLTVLGRLDAWRGNKVNHVAITLMRNGRSSEWTRVEGLASAQQLASVWASLAD
jgi:protein SCO1